MDKKTLLLVGTGNMGREYAKVLKATEVDFVVIGRSQGSVNSFKNELNIDAASGGITKWLRNNQTPKWAIVAVTGDQLGKVSRELIKAGCNKILIEKPGGLDGKDIRDTARLAKKQKTS